MLILLSTLIISRYKQLYKCWWALGCLVKGFLVELEVIVLLVCFSLNSYVVFFAIFWVKRAKSHPCYRIRLPQNYLHSIAKISSWLKSVISAKLKQLTKSVPSVGKTCFLLETFLHYTCHEIPFAYLKVVDSFWDLKNTKIDLSPYLHILKL